MEDLVAIFDMKNSLSHPIFHEMKPLELNKTEYEKLIAYYKDGLV